MTESMPTPRELAEMIVNAQYDSKKPNINILVDELLAYMKDEYPRKTAQLQIESAIENIQVKEKKKNKPDKNRHSLLDDAYTYAIKLIQQKGTEDIVNTQLELFYWFESDGLTLEQSYEIIHKAKEEFEQVIPEEPEFKTGQELISKKETEISTSIEVHGESQDEIESSTSTEVQVESQDEIESRLYSVALNFLFNFQDPGKKILRSELIKVMNDYIEYFSLKYSAVQKLADKAIAEFREKSRTTPEFKTAYHELYKTEEKISSKPAQSQDLKIEKKKPTVVKPVSGSKVRLNHDVKHQEKINLDDRDKKIIFQFSIAKVASYVLQYLGIPKATFYRKIKKLTDLGILVKLEEKNFSRYIVSPRFKQSLEMRLVVGARTSPKTQSTSKTAPISEQGDLVPHSKSQSQPQIEEIPSDSKDLGGASETAYQTTSKNASLPKKEEESQHPSEDPRDSLVSSSPDREKLQEKHETKSETISKTPSFEELIKLYDPHNLRSHSYLFSVEIINPPTNYFELLEEDSNWLECHGGMKNWPWFRGELQFYNIDTVVRFYTKKITIRIIEIWGTDSFINDSIADDIVLRTLATIAEKYQLEFGTIEKIYGEPVPKKLKIKVKDTHHALPFHPIAIRAFALNYTSKGTRFGVDDSKGNKELEAHNHKYSTEDINNYIEDCDYMAEEDRWIRAIDKDVIENKETQEVLFENLAISDKTQEKIVDKIIQSLTRNEQSIQTIIQKIDHYSEEIQSIKQSAFTDQQFQNNLLSAIDHLGSFLTDIKEEQSETNLILSRGLKDIVDQKIKELISSIQSRPKLPRLQQLIFEFLKKNPNENGYTRNELALETPIKLNSVNPTVVSLKNKGLIGERKIGRERGRIFLI